MSFPYHCHGNLICLSDNTFALISVLFLNIITCIISSSPVIMIGTLIVNFIVLINNTIIIIITTLYTAIILLPSAPLLLLYSNPSYHIPIFKTYLLHKCTLFSPSLSSLFSSLFLFSPLFSSSLPLGGGRNEVSPRLLRHFHMVWLTNLSEPYMCRIFSSILQVHRIMSGKVR